MTASACAQTALLKSLVVLGSRILSWLALWEVLCTVSATLVTSSTRHAWTQGTQARRAQVSEKTGFLHLWKRAARKPYIIIFNGQDHFDSTRKRPWQCAFFFYVSRHYFFTKPTRACEKKQNVFDQCSRQPDRQMTHLAHCIEHIHSFISFFSFLIFFLFPNDKVKQLPVATIRQFHFTWYMTFLRGQGLFDSFRLFSTDQHCERIRLPEIACSKCEARTCFTTEIPNQTQILVLSKQDLSTLTRVHGARFQQGTWWLLVLRHQTRLLKTAAWSSQEGIDICSTLWRMCMNRKHHAFSITNGLRRRSNRLLQSDYAEGESFYPSSSQKPWRNCNVHSTASLQVQHASVMAATPNQQLFLFDFDNAFFFFFFNFQPKAMRAGDKKHRKKKHMA